MRFQASKPVRLTIEDERGVTVVETAYHGGIESYGSRAYTVSFRVEGETVYTPNQPPPGSIVKATDGRAFQRKGNRWVCHDGTSNTWPVQLELGAEVLYWEEAKK
jgi:hypothetical protein